MTNFIVYRSLQSNEEIEYLAFSEEFLNHPCVQGAFLEFRVFLPAEGTKYYQYVEAQSSEEAIEAAKKTSHDHWKRSLYNWGGP